MKFSFIVALVLLSCVAGQNGYAGPATPSYVVEPHSVSATSFVCDMISCKYNQTGDYLGSEIFILHQNCSIYINSTVSPCSKLELNSSLVPGMYQSGFTMFTTNYSDSFIDGCDCIQSPYGGSLFVFICFRRPPPTVYQTELLLCRSYNYNYVKFLDISYLYHTFWLKVKWLSTDGGGVFSFIYCVNLQLFDYFLSLTPFFIVLLAIYLPFYLMQRRFGQVILPYYLLGYFVFSLFLIPVIHGECTEQSGDPDKIFKQLRHLMVVYDFSDLSAYYIFFPMVNRKAHNISVGVSEFHHNVVIKGGVREHHGFLRLHLVKPSDVDFGFPGYFIDSEVKTAINIRLWRRLCIKNVLDSIIVKFPARQQDFWSGLANLNEFIDGFLLYTNIVNTGSNAVRALLIYRYFSVKLKDGIMALMANSLTEIDAFLEQPDIGKLDPKSSSYSFSATFAVAPRIYHNLVKLCRAISPQKEPVPKAPNVEELQLSTHQIACEVIKYQINGFRYRAGLCLIPFNSKKAHDQIFAIIAQIPVGSLYRSVLSCQIKTGVNFTDSKLAKHMAAHGWGSCDCQPLDSDFGMLVSEYINQSYDLTANNSSDSKKSAQVCLDKLNASRIENFKDSISDVLSLLASYIGSDREEMAPQQVGLDTITDVLSSLTALQSTLTDMMSFRVVKCVATVVALTFVVIGGPDCFSWSAFKKMHDEMTNLPVLPGLSVVEHLVATLRWIMNFGIRCYTGQLDLFANAKVSAWLSKVGPYANYMHEISHYNFNPETGKVDLTTHQFYKVIHDYKTHGQMVLENAKINAPSQVRAVQKALSDLSSVVAKIDAFLSCNAAKEAPFCAVACGPSKIYKSTFIDYMRVALQTSLKLPTDECFTYNMPPEANFTDGFVTSHHTIIIDDIASKRPGPGIVDRTIQMIIQLINNMVFNMESASVEQKGKNYWVGKLVLGTTNTPDMNAAAYFTHQAAALRRMPYLIHLDAKRMNSDGSPNMDRSDFSGSVADGVDNRIFNFWKIRIEHVTPVYNADPENQGGVSRRTILETSDTAVALKKLVKLCRQHFDNQAIYMDTIKNLRKMNKCYACSNLLPLCTCHDVEPIEQQSGDTSYVPMNQLTYFFVFCGFIGVIPFVYRTLSSLYYYIINCGNYCIAILSSIASIFHDLNIASGSLIACIDECSAGYNTVKGRALATKHFVCNNKWWIAAGFVAVSTAIMLLIQALSSFPASQQMDVSAKMPPVNMWAFSKSAPALSDKSMAAGGSSAGPAAIGLASAMVKIYVSRSHRTDLTNEVFQGSSLSGVQSQTAYGMILGDPYPGMIATTKHTLEKRVLQGVDLGPIIRVDIFKVTSGSLLLGGKQTHICTIDGAALKYHSHSVMDFAVIECANVTNKNGLYGWLLRHPYNEPPDRPELLSMTVENNPIKSIVMNHGMLNQEFYYTFSHNPTQAGDCGRPLVGLLSGKFYVAGLHSAGSPEAKTGRAMLVTQDIVQQTIKMDFAAEQSFVLGLVSMPDVGSSDDWFNTIDGEPIQIESGNKHTGVNPEYGLNELYNVEYMGNTGRLNSFSSDFEIPRFAGHFEEYSGVSEKVIPNLDPRDKQIGWLPIKTYLSNVGAQPGDWDTEVLNTCKVALVNWFKSKMAISVIPGTRCLTIDEVVNGFDFPGLECLNMKTGFGFPENTKKIAQFDGSVLPNGKMFYTLASKQADRLNRCIQDLESAETICFVCNGVRKDEPIKPKKMFERGCRLIFAAPTLMTCLLRRYFGSLIHFLYMNRLSCGVAVGINCRNIEWTALFYYLTSVGFNCIAGDFVNFDQKLPAIITGTSLQVLFDLNLLMGVFSDKDKIAMMTLLKSVLNHSVVIDKGLYRVRGPNPSGQALTTQTNCIAVILMLMYVWVKCGYQPELFLTETRFTTYGDDHVICVPPQFDKFTYDAIATCLEPLGIDYTTFDKQPAKGKTYDDIRDVQFLKCAFKVTKDCVTAPIDISSIKRRMQISRKPKVDVGQHELDVLSSIWYDSFLHADQYVIQDLIRSWCTKNDLEMDSGRFPSDIEYREKIIVSSAETKEYYGLDCPYSVTIESKFH